MAVNLENLDKIRSPVRNCEGFDLKEFDKVILVNWELFIFALKKYFFYI